MFDVMKNKVIILCMSILFMVSSAAAVELSYDSGPYTNGVRISDTFDYRARVRFTPSSDVIGGILQNVSIYWCGECSEATSLFSILVYDCNDTEEGSNVSQFDPLELSAPNVRQSIDVSSLGFVVGPGDFCVEVRAREPQSREDDIFIFWGGNNSNVDRSYHFGYLNSSWYSLIDLQSFIPSLRELAIQAVVLTELPPTTTTTTMATTTTTTMATTTTTLPSNGGGGSTGGGGSVIGGVGRNCFDDIQNCHHGDCEEGIDCGGPCDPCMNCSDGIQNQGEVGIDCGGPCIPCPVVSTTSTTSTTIPGVVFPAQCSEGCDRVSNPLNPFVDCVSCVSELDCVSVCEGDVCDLAQYCFNVGEDYSCGCCCQAAVTSTTIVVPPVVGRVVAFPGGGKVLVSIFILFILLFLFLFKGKRGGVK